MVMIDTVRCLRNHREKFEYLPERVPFGCTWANMQYDWYNLGNSCTPKLCQEIHPPKSIYGISKDAGAQNKEL